MTGKKLFFNHLLFAGLFLFALVLQNRIWPAFFGLPIFLFPAFLVYGALYRKPVFVIFMLYFISFCLAGSSALPFSFLLAFNSFLTLLLLLFRKVYSTNILFFSLTCALVLFLFPVFVFLFAKLIGDKPYIYGPVFWIGGALLSWCFCLPFLRLFQTLDNWTLSPALNKPIKGVR